MVSLSAPGRRIKKAEVARTLLLPKTSAKENSMPISLTSLSLVEAPVTLKEGLKILERDNFRCQYCGLDGKASFENALVMSVDFVIPRARKGKKSPENLVACCRPCNTIKGKHVYKNFEDAKAHVLAAREKLRQGWEAKNVKAQAKAASA
jgi:hypothetical protein